MSQPVTHNNINYTNDTVQPDAFGKTIAANNNIVQVTRVVNVSICASLEELSNGGAGRAKWAPVEGKQVQVFGLDAHNELGIDNGHALNTLRAATITNATLRESSSTFPVPLGVNVSCLPKNEIVENGERYTFCALPESKVSSPYTLFKADADMQESQQWRNQYKEYNATNLETQGILEVQNCPYVFVKDTHPIVAVLRVNPDIIGTYIDNQPKIDGEWYKISRSVLEQCCHALKTQVLNKLSTHDLTNFQVNIERVGGQEWMDLNDMLPVRARIAHKIPHNATMEQINEIEDESARHFMSTPYEYHARIELTYELEN